MGISGRVLRFPPGRAPVLRSQLVGWHRASPAGCCPDQGVGLPRALRQDPCGPPDRRAGLRLQERIFSPMSLHQHGHLVCQIRQCQQLLWNAEQGTPALR